MTKLQKCFTVAGFMMIAAPQATAQMIENGALDRPLSRVDESRSLNIGVVNPAFTYTFASVGSGGVGLRNRPGGSIDVSGVTKPARAAYLYWTIISSGALSARQKLISIQRTLPSETPYSWVSGVIVGQGISPCWGGDRITVLRAAIPVSIANGNGSYAIRLPTGVPGVVDGSDPWQRAQRPHFNGASLVIVGAGSASVAIYDNGLSGRTFFMDTGITYSLSITSAYAQSSTLRLHQISSDGQDQYFLAPNNQRISSEITFVNNVRISGPGSSSHDSDWNGAAGGPIAQLWDNTISEIGRYVSSTSTRVNMRVVAPRISGVSDCVTPVANVLSTR